MSSPNDVFECHWRASCLLLAGYWGLLCLALIGLIWLELPWWLRLVAGSACLLQTAWLLPRKILLSHPQAITGLRRTPAGWSLWSQAQGWQAIQLRPDSMALPGCVVLRFRRPGQLFSRGLCIAADAMEREAHRRLRVRLKFSRRRWRAPE